jgi:hypothetical protein
MLEEIKVPLELRVDAIRMHVNVISKFKNTEGWSKEISCNIGGKLIMSLKTIVSQSIFVFGVKKGSSLRLSSPLLSYTDVKFGVAVYLESHGERLR